MRMEDLKDGFPRMPEEMRQMVEREVYCQMNGETGRDSEKEAAGGTVYNRGTVCDREDLFKQQRNEQQGNADENNGWGNGEMRRYDENRTASERTTGRRSSGHRKNGRKTMVVILAAAMALGTTVFAGTRLYQVYAQKEGEYGLKTGIQVQQEGQTETLQTAPEGQVPVVELKANYLPEGMAAEADTQGRYYFEEEPNMGGISCQIMIMDSDDTDQELLTKDVVASEEVSLSGHDGVYLELYKLDSVKNDFIRRMYLFYPEVSRVLAIYAREKLPKEELLKFAENVELKATGEYEDAENLGSWSDYVNPETEIEEEKPVIKQLENTHQIGETFTQELYAYTIEGEFVDPSPAFEVKVASVEVADDLQLLTMTSRIEENMIAAVGEDGKLKDNEIQFIKSGDGIQTVDEVLETRQVGQKLVYLTVEITNPLDYELKNVLVWAYLSSIVEKDGEMAVYDRSEEVPGCDAVLETGAAQDKEMQYYDLSGGEDTNGSNYIGHMDPGETVTAHFGYIVNEDELGNLYFNLKGTPYMITEEALAAGYVDVRQN